MVKLFWHQVKNLDLSARFELIPADFNPADSPTRDAALPFPGRRKSKFGISEALRFWVESEEMNECQLHQTQINPHV